MLHATKCIIPPILKQQKTDQHINITADLALRFDL